MSENPKAAWVAAIALGYMLGRTKKGKVALTLVSVAAGRNFPPSPQTLLSKGVRTLRESPQFAQAGGQLWDHLKQSGFSSLSSATDRTLNSLADAVCQRTQALGGDEANGDGEKGTKSEAPAGRTGSDSSPSSSSDSQTARKSSARTARER